MKITKIISALVISVILISCATNYDNAQPSKVASGVKIQDSDFDSKVTYIGPQIRENKQQGLFAEYQYIRLRGFKDKKTNQISHQLYVAINYTGDWRYYQQASFQGGKTEQLDVIKRDVEFCGVGCNYTETLGLNLSSTFMQSNINGFQIRFDSKSGHKSVIEIPANYIQGYLSVVK